MTSPTFAVQINGYAIFRSPSVAYAALLGIHRATAYAQITALAANAYLSSIGVFEPFLHIINLSKSSGALYLLV